MDTLNKLISYLTRLIPLLIMSILCLLSFILAKQKTDGTQDTDASLNHSSDHNYYLRHFSVTHFDPLGKIKSLANGDYALHFESAEYMDVQRFAFFSVNEDFHYNGVSDTAHLSDDGNDAKLYRQARIERTAPKLSSLITTFESDYFHFTQYPDTVSTNLPVKIHRDKDVITADSLHYDSDERMLLLTGRVKIKVTPKQP